MKRKIVVRELVMRHPPPLPLTPLIKELLKKELHLNGHSIGYFPNYIYM